MTQTEDKKDPVQTLIDKAATQGDGGEAMRYAQSALNCAHALQVVKITEKTQ